VWGMLCFGEEVGVGKVPTLSTKNSLIFCYGPVLDRNGRQLTPTVCYGSSMLYLPARGLMPHDRLLSLAPPILESSALLLLLHSLALDPRI
jgi:hypothetical protein